ncbi:hypothetical protein DPEC_G00151080 [Dallia pectoralis]|uniref:Uncharacterized protein n=1 Tax=Dallia pectoralis TaxID=75939 RepID=A0ACC2GIY2_DALPE|nr:hypothetical protein DPEC_G00151080 [Dallia pectoralis]
MCHLSASNDNRPVALTSRIIKTFGRPLVALHLLVKSSLDLLWFAYQAQTGEWGTPLPSCYTVSTLTSTSRH